MSRPSDYRNLFSTGNDVRVQRHEQRPNGHVDVSLAEAPMKVPYRFARSAWEATSATLAVGTETSRVNTRDPTKLVPWQKHVDSLGRIGRPFTMDGLHLT